MAFRGVPGKPARGSGTLRVLALARVREYLESGGKTRDGFLAWPRNVAPRLCTSDLQSVGGFAAIAAEIRSGDIDVALDFDDVPDTSPGLSADTKAKPAFTSVRDPEPRELLELRREREKRSEAERRLKSALDALAEAEQRAGVVADLRAAEPPPIVRRERASGLREATAVVCASDLHLEEVVNPAAIEYRNAFNPEIAKARMLRMAQAIPRLIEKERSMFAIRDLVLWLGGDMITGYLHEENPETNALTPIEAVLFAYELLAQLIRYQLDHADVEKITIAATVGNHGRCHDAETELLTRDGWKTYDRLTVGELVATYRMDDGLCEWQPLLDVYVAAYDGPMYRVRTRTANFVVTPRHRMVRRDFHNGSHRFEHMEDMDASGTAGAGCFPKCAEGTATELPGVTDDELTLLGWVLTDGCYHGKDRTVALYQSKPHGIDALNSLLTRLKIEYTTKTRLRPPPCIEGKQVKNVLPETRFNISRASARRILELLPDKKRLPEWTYDLSKRQFDVLLAGLLAGDGHVRRSERVLYGRREFLTQVQALAVVNGVPARLREDNRGNHVLSLPSAKYTFIASKDWGKSVVRGQYDGTIWCGTVANGTLITRRNGIPLVSGNTTKFTHAKTRVENSYEFLLYRHLQQSFAHEPRVSFHIAAGSHLYLEVYEQTIRFHHGDDIKYAGGVGGITIPIRKALSSWSSFRHADLSVFGHWHQLLHGRDFVVNGSLIGFNEYALMIKAEYEPPQQAFFLMDSKRGRCCATPIWVDSDDEGWRRT